MLTQAVLTLLGLAPAPQTQLGLAREAGPPLSVPSRLWVVDDSGGADFTNIQSAIDAADSGDAIEVLPGTYAGFVWEDKDLVLFGSGSPVPRIRTKAVIRSIAAADAAVLRNLVFAWGGSATGTLFLSLENSPGTIWIESCSVEGGNPYLDAIQVQDCANVVFLRYTSAAGPLFFFSEDVPTAARVGLRVVDSTVRAYESVFSGPNGAIREGPHPAWPFIVVPLANQEGGHGAVLEGSSVLFASGCEFRGGSPGLATVGCTGPGGGCSYLCVAAEPGGTGLILEDSSTASSLDSDYIAGPGRPTFTVQCCSTPTICSSGGPAGQPFSGPGTLTTIPLPARTYQLDGPSQAGGSYHLKVVGQPGEFVFSVFSERPEGIAFPIYFGVQLTAYPTTFVDEGPLPENGVLEKDVPIPPLMLGTPFDVRYAQGLLFDALANAYLASGSVLIVR